MLLKASHRVRDMALSASGYLLCSDGTFSVNEVSLDATLGVGFDVNKRCYKIDIVQKGRKDKLSIKLSYQMQITNYVIVIDDSRYQINSLKRDSIEDIAYLLRLCSYENEQHA